MVTSFVHRQAAAIALEIAALLMFCVPWPAGAAERGSEQITPLLLAVHDPPMPFKGTGDRTHLAYELWITNFSSGDATVEQVEVLGDGRLLTTFDAEAIATRLRPAGRRDASATLSGGATSLLFVHLTLAPSSNVPAHLSHRVRARVEAAPPGLQEMALSGGDVTVDR